LTGLGWYDKLGKVGGAGTVVPITGFANSVVSPALEFKREGYILGTAANIFRLAGPVLVFGYLASFIAGLLKLITG
jgi:stage V sporulation protein AC